VRFSFAASSALANQIVQGAPADVFASASEATMKQAADAGAVRDPRVFTRNALEIAVPPGDPAHVTGLADLARPEVKVALCQPQVPCGATAQKALAGAGVRVTPVTWEADVKATLTKVTLGEVDAGVVYVTDVRAAGRKVRGIPIPAARNVTTAYPIAALTHAPHPGTAAAFVRFVLSPEGQRVLADDGFEKP
jgi:molybdate transport system substrate-binding protein